MRLGHRQRPRGEDPGGRDPPGDGLEHRQLVRVPIQRAMEEDIRLPVLPQQVPHQRRPRELEPPGTAHEADRDAAPVRDPIGRGGEEDSGEWRLGGRGEGEEGEEDDARGQEGEDRAPVGEAGEGGD